MDPELAKLYESQLHDTRTEEDYRILTVHFWDVVRPQIERYIESINEGVPFQFSVWHHHNRGFNELHERSGVRIAQNEMFHIDVNEDIALDKLNKMMQDSAWYGETPLIMTDTNYSLFTVWILLSDNPNNVLGCALDSSDNTSYSLYSCRCVWC